VAITNGRWDGFAALARTFGPWEQILGTAVPAGLGVRWTAKEAGVGQDHLGIIERQSFWISS
jgi:hypothetical protein